MDFHFPVVFDIAQFAEFVHELANPSASKSPAARSSEPKQVMQRNMSTEVKPRD
jgi:hypothetical protein